MFPSWEWSCLVESRFVEGTSWNKKSSYIVVGKQQHVLLLPFNKHFSSKAGDLFSHCHFTSCLLAGKRKVQRLPFSRGQRHGSLSWPCRCGHAGHADHAAQVSVTCRGAGRLPWSMVVRVKTVTIDGAKVVLLWLGTCASKYVISTSHTLEATVHTVRRIPLNLLSAIRASVYLKVALGL